MAIVRNLDGYSSVTSDNPLGALDRLDPTKWCVFYDDFVKYDVGQGAVYYTHTATGGADTIVGPTGVLVLTTGATDNNLSELQLVEAPFQLTSGKKAFFEARVKVDITTTLGEEEWAVGLFSVETGTNFFNAGGTARTMQDGWGFVSYDGNTNFDCLQGEATVFSTETSAAAYADATWMTLSVYYDGSQSTFFKDDALIATLTTNEPTSVLTPTLYIKTGEVGTTKILNVDYVIAIFER